MLTELATFLRCCVRQGVSNGVRLQFGQHGCIRTVPRGQKFTFTLRAGTADVAVFRQVFVDREYDDAMLTGMRPRQIIDAGAHIGSASVFFAQKFPEARIIAIEPDRMNFELLTLNTKCYENVVPINAALWCEDTRVGLSNPAQTTWAFRVDAGINGGNVRAVTVPTLLKEFDIANIDILKMDVEGAEKDIFENNASDWLSRVGMLCIELHDRFRPGASRAVYSKAVEFPFIKDNRGELDFLQFTGQGTRTGSSF